MRLDFPTFPHAEQSVPWDLFIFAHENGASLNRHKLIWGESYKHFVGLVIEERIPLLVKIHANFDDKVKCGEWTYKTVNTYCKKLKILYKFAESKNTNLSILNIEHCFAWWQEETQQLIGEGNLSCDYTNTLNVLAGIIGRLLGKPANVLKLANKHPKSFRNNFPVSQNYKTLDSTVFDYGRNLYDIRQSLSIDDIYSQIPIRISLRSGDYFDHWGRMVRPENVRAITNPDSVDSWHVKNTRVIREDASLSQSKAARDPFLNLRLQVEMMIFISQTSVPPSTAYEMERFIFKRGDRIDGTIQVECWKNRLRDNITFTLYEEYWPIFQEYLAFRDKVFPEATSLFPLSGKQGVKRQSFAPIALRKLLSNLNQPYLSPTALKNHRINYFTRNTDVRVALIVGQKSLSALSKHYNTPEVNTAIREWTIYFSSEDAKRKNLLSGSCHELSPSPVNNEKYNVEPDCKTPSGCLGCSNFRGIDSLDFIWAMLSYKALKRLEIQNSLVLYGTEDNIIIFEINRIKEIEDSFKARGQENLKLYEVAKGRIEEGNFHPHWSGYFSLYGLTI